MHNPLRRGERLDPGSWLVAPGDQVIVGMRLRDTRSPAPTGRGRP